MLLPGNREVELPRSRCGNKLPFSSYNELYAVHLQINVVLKTCSFCGMVSYVPPETMTHGSDAIFALTRLR
jgi:hypothetical protein